MNYLILKSIIEATVVNFKCKDCGSSIVEWNLNVLWTAGNSINMEVICPNCKAQWVIKAEIGLVNQLNNPDMMSNIKSTLKWIGQFIVPTNWTSVESINDTDILSIRDNIKKSKSIEDLFKL